jgi:Carboxypeptidase regulatory-like domain
MARFLVAGLPAPCISRALNRVASDTQRSVSITEPRFPRHRGSTQAHLILALLLFASCNLSAQTTSGVFGTVTDQQGLPISGTEIVARHEATAGETRSVTDSDGTFGVLGLQPGMYSVTAEREGFTSKVYSHVDLTVNRQIRLDITLAVGSMQQQVTVGASPPLRRKRKHPPAGTPSFQHKWNRCH